MARFKSDSDARQLGEALAALRRDLGLSQAEAGRRAGMTSQGWGLYETGKRSGLFRPDVQRRLTSALGASPEALSLPRGSSWAASADGRLQGMASAGRDFDAAPSTPTRRMQLSNDDLAPWAASGVLVEYQPGRWPRRDQGCVIEMVDGELRVRLYVRANADALVVRGALGDEVISRRATRSVSAVVARLEY